ncbi:unnamed protein product [Dibothriocephalus latus]|uniref:Uncharacterized protein n=1 Tax=Dibothriocephalus latus TaxID=60516 RepID=A0A3P6QWW2_DIBLA|nr:unnamed protein product [Dibothriocephalus latus]
MVSHHDHQEGQCSCVQQNPLAQTLEEFDFERGIWNCAVYGDTLRLSSLLKSGTKVDAQDNYGYTALHYAARNGRLEVCKILLEHGADACLATNSLKATPLHRAANAGHLAVVKLLAQAGGSPLVLLRDTDGESCLHSVSAHEKPRYFSLLLTFFPIISIHN